MRAMLLDASGRPLRAAEAPEPVPGAGEVLVHVAACGVCRTDLHVRDGELPDPALPLILGHEIVGIVDRLGEGVVGIEPGDRVGVPWLGWTDGTCSQCLAGRENLCENARFTGYTRNGGYAEAVVAGEGTGPSSVGRPRHSYRGTAVARDWSHACDRALHPRRALARRGARPLPWTERGDGARPRLRRVRTDLNVSDSELLDPELRLVSGHEIVGVVDRLGDGVVGIQPGDQVGVPWLDGDSRRADGKAPGRLGIALRRRPGPA
jgi:D-arabinose 1-dehydrogenase-like Zn-dependent alcohol dehydrogenase